MHSSLKYSRQRLRFYPMIVTVARPCGGKVHQWKHRLPTHVTSNIYTLCVICRSHSTSSSPAFVDTASPAQKNYNNRSTPPPLVHKRWLACSREPWTTGNISIDLLTYCSGETLLIIQLVVDDNAKIYPQSILRSARASLRWCIHKEVDGTPPWFTETSHPRAQEAIVST